MGSGKSPAGPDLYTQYVLVRELARIWPSLTEQQRCDQLDRISPGLDRCRDLEQPARDALVRRMILLPEEEIYEALYWEETPLPVGTQESTYLGFQGFLGRYLRWASPGNAPLGYHFWSGITALGAACQRRVFVPAGRRIYMNMYVILGGIQSTGKGQALDAAVKLLERTNKVLEATDPDWEERRINVLSSDTTMESIVTELANRTSTFSTKENGQITVRQNAIDATAILPLDEMATFFGKDAWAQARRAPFLTTLKESDRYTKSTKKDGVETLENTALSMLACCAPDWMQNTIQADLLGGGFMDRTVWIYREPDWARKEQTSVISSPPRDPLQVQFLAEWVAKSISHLDAREPAQLFPKARGLLHTGYQDLVRRERESYLIYGSDSREKTANRAVWIATQLATLIAMSEESFPPIRVREEHVAAAWKIIALEEQSMKQFLEEGLRSKTVYWDRQFLGFIRESECVTRTNLNQKFRRNFANTDDCLRITKNLLDQDMIEQTTSNKTIIYRVKGHRCPRCEVGLMS